MATLQIKVCDNCGLRDDKQHECIKTVYVVIGYQRDAAGSSESVGENVDLCPRCLCYCFGHFLSHINDYEFNKKLLKGILKK